FVVSAAFTGAVYALLHNRVPLLFTAMFALGDLLVLFGFLHVAFGSARIFAGNGEIQSRGGVLGFGVLRPTPFAEVASILPVAGPSQGSGSDRKSTRLNSSHVAISYAVFCLKKKKTKKANENLEH